VPAAIIASAGTASAAARAKPQGYQWPAFLSGSVTGWNITTVEPFPPYTDGSTTTDRWQIAGLKLKRVQIKVMRTQIQVVYKVTNGTVTWSHESTDTCRGPVSFTEALSLKGVKWDRDSRISFFAPRKGRFKNRWQVDGQLDWVHRKVLGPCSGDPTFEGFVSLPSLVSGTRVGGTPPVAKPGKKVRLTYEGRHTSGSPTFGVTVDDRKDTLTIPIPR
jgi:hypothetical protein